MLKFCKCRLNPQNESILKNVLKYPLVVSVLRATEIGESIAPYVIGVEKFFFNFSKQVTVNISDMPHSLVIRVPMKQVWSGM